MDIRLPLGKKIPVLEDGYAKPLCMEQDPPSPIEKTITQLKMDSSGAAKFAPGRAQELWEKALKFRSRQDDQAPLIEPEVSGKRSDASSKN
jgi:hypothetical protein